MNGFNFRAYSASERSLTVANDLLRNHVPRIVISRRHENNTFWYMFDVNDELITKLRGEHLASFENSFDSLENSLNLHEWQSNPGVKVDMASPLSRSPDLWSDLAGGEPKVILGDAGEVRGVVSPVSTPPPHINRLYAGVSCDRTAVEPDVEMEFNLALGAEPQLGFGIALAVKFPSDKEQIEIHAEISSTDFSKPAGTNWYQTFTVDRTLQCKPENWTFKARGLGNRARYSLSVEFSAEGTVLGSIVTSLPRSGGTELPAVATPGLLNLPSQMGAQLHIRITNEGSGVVFNVSADGARQENPIASESKPKVFDYFFDLLGTVDSLADIKQKIAYGLTLELPDALQQILTQHAGVTTLFSGKEPLAPFELLQLNPRQNGQLLGIERPVSRWITRAMGDNQRLKVGRVGCIRPPYQGSDSLPETEKEEALLARRFNDSQLVRVKDKKGFDAMMNETDVDLLHFAGHADGNPAYLSLLDYHVGPESFGPAMPLFQNRQPFFFLNACRTAVGTRSAPAIVGNFARALLASQCFCGVVAPYIKVDSRAALRVAEMFYDETLGSGLSVDAALQGIRKLALEKDVPDVQRASMLSYLAFARPGLKLT